jgi:hypothetical protein
MNWLTAMGLAGVCVVAVLALLRVERRAVWLVLVLLVIPGVVVLTAWATIGGQWPEVLAGVVLAAVVCGGWWMLVGRRLPRPSSDTIAVWGQEKAPKPSASEMAALQAEVLRLKEENERLEARVKRDEGRATKDDGR